MNWTTTAPSKPGDYWFRLPGNKPPQIVSVHSGKVIFKSGRTEKISNVVGEWGDPIESTGTSINEIRASSHSSSTGGWPKLIVPILVSALVSGGLVKVWDEPYFVYAGSEKEPEIEQDTKTTPHKISFKVFPIFKNWGLKPGHLEDAKFSHRELAMYPENVEVNYCDHAPISFLSVFSGKTIVCNFVATIDPQKAIEGPVTFQVSYYGPGGHEIHTESYRTIPQFKRQMNKPPS